MAVYLLCCHRLGAGATQLTIFNGMLTIHMLLPRPNFICLICCAVHAVEQVQELELSVDVRSLDKLLDFLSCSFQGGTDVDKPLQLSLERLQKDEWAKVRW
jgi:hypothetical protein